MKPEMNSQNTLPQNRSVYKRNLIIFIGFILLARILLTAKALAFLFDEEIVYRLKDFLNLSEGKGNVHKAIALFQDYYKVLHYKEVFIKLFVAQFSVIAAVCLVFKARFSFEPAKGILFVPIVTIIQISVLLILGKTSVNIIVFAFILNSLLFISNTAVIQKAPWIGIGALALFPFVSELILPGSIVALWSRVCDRTKGAVLGRIVFVITFAVTSSLVISAISFYGYFQYAPQPKQESLATRILPGDFHGLEMGTKSRRLFAMEIGTSVVYVFDFDKIDLPYRTFEIETGELEHIAINEQRNEIYHFDRDRIRLYVYDLETLIPTRQSPLLKAGMGSAKVAFDNRSKTIAVKQEGNYCWILDMDTLEPIAPVIETHHTDVLSFDQTSGQYLLSIDRDSESFRAISTDGKTVRDIPAAKNQLTITSSAKRREVYLALPLKGQVYVYDAVTMTLKKKIETVFGVRGVACDEKHSLLITTSMFTGYVDVIDLNSGRSIQKKFVQYYLRGVVLNSDKREAFVASIHGLYRFDY